jgi:hypothetical protein
MGLNDPVKQTQLPPIVARIVGLGVLTFGGIMLVVGIVRLSADYWDSGSKFTLVGVVLIGLGVAIERDRYLKTKKAVNAETPPIESKEESNAR